MRSGLYANYVSATQSCVRSVADQVYCFDFGQLTATDASFSLFFRVGGHMTSFLAGDCCMSFDKAKQRILLRAGNKSSSGNKGRSWTTGQASHTLLYI